MDEFDGIGHVPWTSSMELVMCRGRVRWNWSCAVDELDGIGHVPWTSSMELVTWRSPSPLAYSLLEMNPSLKRKSIFLLRPVDRRVQVWRHGNIAFHDGNVMGTTAFSGGGVTAWGTFNCKLIGECESFDVNVVVILAIE